MQLLQCRLKEIKKEKNSDIIRAICLEKSAISCKNPASNLQNLLWSAGLLQEMIVSARSLQEKLICWNLIGLLQDLFFLVHTETLRTF